MKTTTRTTTTTTGQRAFRLLAALIFLCFLAPMASGQGNSTTLSYWKENLDGVDKIANAEGGDGSSWDDPIVIATAKELAYFAQQVNSGLPIRYGSGSDAINPTDNEPTGGGFGDCYFALDADIDLSGHYWTPIGNYYNPFRGNFDGRGHRISGLKVKVIEQSNSYAYAGLFGNTEYGTLQNIGVHLSDGEGIQVNGSDITYAGGIAATASHIHNCYVVGKGFIEASTSNPSSVAYAGGIVGSLRGGGSLTNCYTTVNVKVLEGISYAGGIVSYCYSGSTISNTYATGDVETKRGDLWTYSGGICGYLMGKLENSLAANGKIAGGNSFTNRIVGEVGGSSNITSNYASPDILVNDKVITGGTGNDLNGDPITFYDLQATLAAWQDAWTFPDVYLPQLRVRKVSGSSTITYTDWPSESPQSLIDPSVLPAGGIINKGGGDGSSWEKAILIANRGELAYFAQQVNAGENLSVKEGVTGSSIENKAGNDSGFKGYYFALAADIDLSAHYWTPIGRTNSFKGNFDGRGHRISGLKVKVIGQSGPSSVYAGLFGNTMYGTLQNIGVHLSDGEGIQADGLGDAFAGGIAAKASYIRNCYVVGKGFIEASTSNPGSGASAGGIVGFLSGGSLTNCYTTVNVKVLDGMLCYAGGIVGYCDFGSTISNIYATGDVETGRGDYYNYSGGICGFSRGTLENSLAANGKLAGVDLLYTNRIVGAVSNGTITSNYASPDILVNDKVITGGAPDNRNGAPTYLETFAADLTGSGWNNGDEKDQAWEDFSSGTYLPQLKIRNQADDGYETWPESEQPFLKAEDYLPLLRKPKLYIVSPAGGTLTVKDDQGNPVTNGMAVDPGTPLTLAYTENSNYSFTGYLSGPAADQLTSLADNPVNMPLYDYWLSASFCKEESPTPPPYVPVYYDVSLPEVEGATTDPEAGVYSVEAWDSFRFYLTLDTAYNQSQPVVTTSRNEIIKPRTSDGAYLVKYVRSDLEIYIDGIVKNNAVANEPIRAKGLEPEIWGESSWLCIRLAEDMGGLSSAGSSLPEVRIFTLDGRLYETFHSSPGLNRRQLPTGIYIVRVGDTVRKVAVR